MNTTSKTKKSRSFPDRIKSLDLYGQSFQFLLPNGKKTRQTWLGCAITFLAIVIIVFYAIIQFLRMIHYGEPQIMISTRDSHFGSDE